MGSRSLFRMFSSVGAETSSGRGIAADSEQSKGAGPPAQRIGMPGSPAQSGLHPHHERDEKRNPAAAVRSGSRNIPLEYRLRILCCVIFAPGFLLALVLLSRAKTPWPVIAGTLGFLVVVFLIFMGMLVEQIVRPLQTMANVVASLREGDYSFRARGSKTPGALGELSLEINSLADMLQGQRLSELEATALLRNVVVAMDAPVLAFDRANNLRLINPAAERLLDLTAEMAIGRNAFDLHLAQFLHEAENEAGADRRIITIGQEANAGRWMVRRSTFRQRGVPHTLLILSDVSAALRQQEQQAWRRLIRVLGHEINNSLTPIKSIAATLRSRMQAEPTGGDPDFDKALKIIESRADSLNRFVQAYRQLAQLPQPVFRRASLRPLMERVAALETRVNVEFEPGPDLLLEMDPDQMEQLMINLIRNAVEATLARSSESKPPYALPNMRPEVKLSWRVDREVVEILVSDNGTGLSNPSNLFVPFYTTKAGGSGVGLTLVRQICEAHGGAVDLTNRPDGPGCQARVRIRHRR
jgi:two-component system, NtrC family, nitrogen regulation sensor histidine kinase NtrY